jgi:hypothetical protein
VPIGASALNAASLVFAEDRLLTRAALQQSRDPSGTVFGPKPVDLTGELALDQ